eukprot:TRINITY_DN2192_c0_g1_i6.p1 TRINITY_DN2192_c0_g1~~TRINITY_DN2192_c0_g1_i6.p1  ORF type:complete len:219 (-),score=53.02 TRINITY_DN2192_c0_g1_i6:26-682(-)
MGIELLTSKEELDKHMNNMNDNAFDTSWLKGGSVVISEYITKPYLINKKKFDLRLYVFVKSFLPLEAYISKKGFARFCSEDYTIEHSQLNNSMIHLTNVARQKKNAKKWDLERILNHIEIKNGKNVGKKVWQDIKEMIKHSLLSCSKVITSNEHCFELFGYDVLLDENLKPWLMEVNGSPSLEPSDEMDFVMKETIISNCIDLLFPEEQSSANVFEIV